MSGAGKTKASYAWELSQLKLALKRLLTEARPALDVLAATAVLADAQDLPAEQAADAHNRLAAALGRLEVYLEVSEDPKEAA